VSGHAAKMAAEWGLRDPVVAYHTFSYSFGVGEGSAGGCGAVSALAWRPVPLDCRQGCEQRACVVVLMTDCGNCLMKVATAMHARHSRACMAVVPCVMYTGACCDSWHRACALLCVPPVAVLWRSLFGASFLTG
jgi:hypothetical protein